MTVRTKTTQYWPIITEEADHTANTSRRGDAALAAADIIYEDLDDNLTISNIQHLAVQRKLQVPGLCVGVC